MLSNGEPIDIDSDGAKADDEEESATDRNNLTSGCESDIEKNLEDLRLSRGGSAKSGYSGKSGCSGKSGYSGLSGTSRGRRLERQRRISSESPLNSRSHSKDKKGTVTLEHNQNLHQVRVLNRRKMSQSSYSSRESVVVNNLKHNPNRRGSVSSNKNLKGKSPF